jgi:hypothetical protein
MASDIFVRARMPALRLGVVVLAALAALFAPGPRAQAQTSAVWRFAPALAPAAPPGEEAALYPVPVGEVGQISFWAPNRGLLITGGTQNGSPPGPVPAGLYAYDGENWHELSTVCGGSQGRIAWAGPDEFWTISDQRPGQVTAQQQRIDELQSLSLCHFLDGEVVGSYAMPLGVPGSYLKMDAAACLSADDCWFGGRDGQGSNAGSFHLHWNGSEVVASYDLSDHAVTSMANLGGKIWEGLAIGPEDTLLPGEEALHPSVIRTISPAGQASLCGGGASPFCNAFLFSEGHQLPAYPLGVLPDALTGFDVASDGSPLGVGATQLWAAADPAPGVSPAAPLTILRDSHGGWAQVLPTSEGSIPLPPGTTLGGSRGEGLGSDAEIVGAQALAPEPDTGDVWLSLYHEAGGAAEVALLEGSGSIAETDELPGPQDPVGFRGRAGPIACAAPHDCWMATERAPGPDGRLSASGWLFHLTDGSRLPLDTDPNLDKLITSRPADASVPTIYPDAPPVDDSLANQQPAAAPSAPPLEVASPPAKVKRVPPLVMRVKSRLEHHRVLVISFTLTARAHVRLIARRRKQVVAQTRLESLRPGPHTLSLSLDPARWPTGLQFQAKPIGAQAPSGSPSSSETIST